MKLSPIELLLLRGGLLATQDDYIEGDVKDTLLNLIKKLEKEFDKK